MDANCELPGHSADAGRLFSVPPVGSPVDGSVNS
jgi:hypothetical protein